LVTRRIDRSGDVHLEPAAGACGCREEQRPGTEPGKQYRPTTFTA
jgi:hypothetical protein